MAEAFVARGSPPRQIGLIVFSIAMAALCVWGTGALTPPAPPPSPDRFWIALSWFGAVVFAHCTLLLVYRLFDRRDQIVVDHRGIVWRRRSDEPIPWQAISKIEVRSAAFSSFLCLWLRHPEAFGSQRLAGWLGRLNRTMRYGDIPVTSTGLNRSFDELVQAVAQHWPEIGP